MGSIENVLDLPDMRKRAAVLEEEASAPDLWDDQAKAQVVTSKLSFLQGEIRKAEALRSRLDDLPILFELAEAEGVGQTAQVFRHGEPWRKFALFVLPRIAQRDALKFAEDGGYGWLLHFCRLNTIEYRYICISPRGMGPRPP